MIDLVIWLTNSKIDQVFALVTNSVQIVQILNIEFCFIYIKILIIGKINANFGCVSFHKLTVYGTKGTFENHLESSFNKKRDINAKFRKLNQISRFTERRFNSRLCKFNKK